MEGLAKRWPRQRLAVLRDVNLTLPSGALALVAGANGAGKTTFLRLLCGLLAPDAGTVSVHGTDAVSERRAYQRRVSYLPAGNTALYARLTVAQQLAFWARLAYLPRDERDARAAHVLELFDLTGLAGRRLDRLSLGQRQRVRLALAFLPPSDLLLLDEPRTSLDDAGDALLAAAVAAHRRAGGAVLWCAPRLEGEELGPDGRFLVSGGRVTEV